MNDVERSIIQHKYIYEHGNEIMDRLKIKTLRLLLEEAKKKWNKNIIKI